MRRPALRGLACGLALLSVTASAAAQDYLDQYKQGLQEIEAGRWEEAARSLSDAIVGRAQESARIPLRFYFRSYLPYYHLGRVRFELGDCPAALAAWDESERQGVVQRFAEYQELQAKRWTCRQRLESEASARAAAIQWSRGRIQRAEATARGVAALAADPDLHLVWSRQPDLLGRRQEGEQLLDRARTLLAAESEAGGLDEIRQAGELAGQAGAALEEVRRQAAALAEDLAAQRREALGQLEELAAAARQELDASSFLSPYPAGISRRRSDLEGVLGEAGQVDPDADPAQVEELSSELVGSLVRLRKAVEPPPRDLREAAAALFAADYPRVIEVLEGARLADPRAAAQAHLLQAAARFALYAIGGEEEPELLAAVRRHILACRQADPNLEPLPRAFSPRFRQLFATTLPAPGPPGG